MLISDLLKESQKAILSNKVRSGLTILGIVIGIASVIAMISLGEGTQKMIQSNIESLGSNLLTVYPGFSRSSQGLISSGRGSALSLKNEDIEVIKNTEGVKYVSPETQRRFQIVAPNGTNTNASVIGILPDYFYLRNLNLLSGSYFTEAQNKSLAKVAVLGATVKNDLFGESEAVGSTIRINKINFKVIGVLEEKGGTSFFNFDDTIFIPFQTMQKLFTGSQYLSSIIFNVENKDQIDKVKEMVILNLSNKHKVDPENPDFSIISQADILSTLNQITGTFTLFLSAIAGISLLVGGIGIMNMMLTTVTERTREIGIRKAIGAKKQDITFQFLAESIILTSSGGIIGIFLGWLISVLISRFINIATYISPQSIILAFGVSAFIGIVFGYYPAKKAANLNPIDALRYE
ncbi:MAG: ABC transporter permease, partial [Minisyncoccia bacterium]